jgi:signal transduction histidine kinase
VARHGTLVGIIYLENNRTADAFTPGRVEVVQMLATQAAISIENARLLGNLERARKEAERAREEAERAREEAERASRAKSEFLANINHELRTPMNGIIGTIELLQGTEVNREQRDYLTVARTAAEQLMRIIRDTLDVSRIEAGKLELEPIRFSLDECLATLGRMLSLRPDAPPDAPEGELERARASAGASIHIESHDLRFSLEVAEDVPNTCSAIAIGCCRCS